MKLNGSLRSMVTRGTALPRRLHAGGDVPEGALLGPPPGVPWELLDERLTAWFRSPIVTVAHRPISQWKTSGAQRLWLGTADGRSRILVLKRLDYSSSSLPAASILPFDISRSEQMVYLQAGKHPTVVPRTYLTLDLARLEVGEGSLVVMEDLASGWSRPRLHHDYALVVAKLDTIHCVMSDIGTNAGLAAHQLVRYNEELGPSLAELFERLVMNEPTVLEDPEVGALLMKWDSVRDVLVAPALPPAQSVFVHGDLSPANTFIRWLPTPAVKLIDYEWLGFGFPHADLACLLKRARPSIEESALFLYASRHRSIPPAEHRLLYEWCQICRGLLDAVYFVSHWKLTDPSRGSYLPDFARASLERAWLAARRVRTGQILRSR